MLQLVDQVMAVKHMRAPLGLTEERTAGRVKVVKGAKKDNSARKQTRLKNKVRIKRTLLTVPFVTNFLIKKT